MDFVVQIVKYLFNKKGIEINFDSVDSIFENGVSFPSFISLIYNVDEISGINNSPQSAEDKKHNNDIAIQFLYSKNSQLKTFKLCYTTTIERSDFLFLIITREYFKINDSKIIVKFNSIISSSKFKVSNQDDLVKISNIFLLLNILTNGEVEKVSDDQDNIFDLLSETFQKYNIPLVIDSNSLISYNQIQFLVQIEIIFDIFSKNINNPIVNGNSSAIAPEADSKSISSSDSDSESSSSSDSDSELSSLSDSDLNVDSESYSYSYDNIINTDNTKYNEQEEFYSLMKAINESLDQNDAKRPSVSNFEEGAKRNHIPKYVMSFFKIESIEGLDFDDEYRGEEVLNLSQKQLKNIDIILDLLKKKKKIFNILLFNFSDTKILKASAVLFYQTFLNCFFLRTSKHEMYQRIIRLLCTHETLPEKYDYSLFTHRKTFACLLFFLLNGTVNFDFNLNAVRTSYLNDLYKKTGVPDIIDQIILQISKIRPTNLIFYQLQLIFDKLESASSSRKIVEIFMDAIFSLKKIKTPPFSVIMSSVKAKRQSLIYQNEINDKYRNRKLKEVENIATIKKKVEKPLTFEQRYSNKEIKFNEKSKKKKVEKSFDSFWNKSKLNYDFNNGILYLNENNSKQAQTDWINEISNIQKNVKKRERKSLMVKKGGGIDLSQSILFNRTKNSFQSKLYKIFYYDEDKEIWVFNSDVFQQFSNDKKINIENAKTPLVLLFNSYEEDLISVGSNLINGIYPQIDESDIFIYPLCDRSLSMLNFIVDFTNTKKASIKPIFLLLHVPKSKEKCHNIKLIITEIYLFLSMISDLEIVVFNKNHYMDQVEFIKNLLSINRLFNKKEKEFPIDLNIQSFSIAKKMSASIANKGKNNEISYTEPKFIILINDQTVQFSGEIDKNLNNNQFFANIKNQIKNENIHLHYINVNDSNTYECFLTTLNDIVMKDCSTLFDIVKKFSFVSQFKLSEKCIEAMIKDDFHEEIEKIVFQRYSVLKDQKVLLNEIEKISFGNKNDFILECKEICNLCSYKDIESKRNLIKSELEISSISHLSFIKNLIKQKLFLTKKQIIEIINAHKEFLKDEYFNIIIKLNPDNSLNRFYADNFNIITNQMEKDKIEIIQMFEPFIQKISTKGNIKVQDIKNSLGKSTNYSMKETENLKEVKISVQIGQDLKSEIEQDF